MLLRHSEHLLQHAENSEHAETALLRGSHRIDSNAREILHRVRVDATHDGAVCVDLLSTTLPSVAQVNFYRCAYTLGTKLS